MSYSPANAFHKSHHNFIYLLFYFIFLTLVSLLEGLCFTENNPGRDAKRHSSYSEVNPVDFLPALFYGACAGLIEKWDKIPGRGNEGWLQI